MSKKKLKKALWRSASVLLLMALMVVSKQLGVLPVSATPPEEFQLHFIDVGQGDAMLLTCAGKTAIIDAGTPDSRGQLLTYLHTHGVSKPTYIFATHPHFDHIGGMGAVVDAFGCKTFVMPRATSNTQTFEGMLGSVSYTGAELVYAKEGDKFEMGDVTFEVLSPPEGQETSNLNETSLVLLVRYGEYSFLLTADAEKANEKVYSKLIDEPVTVMKAAHHGSSTSNSKYLLSAAQPKFIVISCGLNNPFGHPHPSVMKRFKKLDCTILRTDQQGSVVFTIKGGELSYETER
ncbi:ComEC/Rec2 family competence protein [Acidaminobacterium chupaoyuni]